MDIKAEIQKVLLSATKGLTSRTFWGIVIISIMYVKGIIDTDKYQSLALIITGGTQLPKIADIVSSYMTNKSLPGVVNQLLNVKAGAPAEVIVALPAVTPAAAPTVQIDTTIKS